MDDEKLILAVRKRPAIYDKHNPIHSNRKAFKTNWIECAAELNVKVDYAKKRWAYLRDYFLKVYRVERETNGAGYKVKNKPRKKRWYFYDEMSFMIPHIAQKHYEEMDDMDNSYDIKDEEEEDNDETNDMDEEEGEDNETNDVEEEEEEENNDETNDMEVEEEEEEEDNDETNDMKEQDEDKESSSVETADQSQAELHDTTMNGSFENISVDIDPFIPICELSQEDGEEPSVVAPGVSESKSNLNQMSTTVITSQPQPIFILPCPPSVKPPTTPINFGLSPASPPKVQGADDHEYFLKSIYPFMKMLDSISVLKFRIDMEHLLLRRVKQEESSRQPKPEAEEEENGLSNPDQDDDEEGEEKTKKCPLCDYETVKEDNLRKHIHRHQANKKPFKCGMCDFSGLTKQQLTIHVRKHTADRPYKCLNVKCGFATLTQQKLQDHVREVH